MRISTKTDPQNHWFSITPSAVSAAGRQKCVFTSKSWKLGEFHHFSDFLAIIGEFHLFLLISSFFSGIHHFSPYQVRKKVKNSWFSDFQKNILRKKYFPENTWFSEDFKTSTEKVIFRPGLKIAIFALFHQANLGSVSFKTSFSVNSPLFH